VLIRRSAASFLLVAAVVGASPAAASAAPPPAAAAAAAPAPPPAVHVTSKLLVKNVGAHGHYERTVFYAITGVKAAVAKRVLHTLNAATLAATTPSRDQTPSQIELDDTVTLARADAHYLTFHQIAYTFPWMAAHGIGTDDPMTFSRDTGAQLHVTDWIKKGQQKMFLAALSSYSRAWLKAHADKYSSDPTFYIGGTKPTLANFSSYEVTSKGWVIHFSPYQVAPYVAGLIHVTVPWSTLKGLIARVHPTKGA
jgi:hypothetical protein